MIAAELAVCTLCITSWSGTGIYAMILTKEKKNATQFSFKTNISDHFTDFLCKSGVNLMQMKKCYKMLLLLLLNFK